MTPVESLTHDEISVVAARKLKSMGYIAALPNLAGGSGEQPDAMGVKSCGETFLVEVKVSRSDFLSDAKKPWRQPDTVAIGHYRAYLTPKGLLKPEEIPYGWQLWEVHGKTKPIVKVIKGQVIKYEKSPHFKSDSTWGIRRLINCDAAEYSYFADKCHNGSVAGLLAAVIDRIESDGIDVSKYAGYSIRRRG